MNRSRLRVRLHRRLFGHVPDYERAGDYIYCRQCRRDRDAYDTEHLRRLQQLADEHDHHEADPPA